MELLIYILIINAVIFGLIFFFKKQWDFIINVFKFIFGLPKGYKLSIKKFKLSRQEKKLNKKVRKMAMEILIKSVANHETIKKDLSFEIEEVKRTKSQILALTKK